MLLVVRSIRPTTAHHHLAALYHSTAHHYSTALYHLTVHHHSTSIGPLQHCTLRKPLLVFAARIEPGLALSKTQITEATVQSFGGELSIFEISNHSGVADFASSAHVPKF